MKHPFMNCNAATRNAPSSPISCLFLSEVDCI